MQMYRKKIVFFILNLSNYISIFSNMVLIFLFSIIIKIVPLLI